MIFLRNKIFIITLGAIAAATMFLSANFSNSSIVQAEELAKPETQTAKQEENTDIVDQGKCGNTAHWELTKAGKLVISGTGDIYDYTGHCIDPGWAKYKQDIIDLEIRDGITSIGSRAFESLTKLQKVKIADDVTKINSYAFQNCCNITEVVANFVDFVGDYAFCDCKKLKEVFLNDDAVNIGKYAFQNCSDSLHIEPTYFSLQGAGNALRKALIDRKQNISILIANNSKAFQEFKGYESIGNKIFNEEVFKEIEAVNAGEYLRSSIDGRTDPIYREERINAHVTRLFFDFKYITNSKQEKMIHDKVADILNSLDISTKSDYHKIKAIFDYIISNVTVVDYSLTNDKDIYHTAYGALFGERTVCCQGFAMLFYIMCKQAGIKHVLIVRGEVPIGNPPAPRLPASKLLHEWNLVKVDNYYYHVDCLNAAKFETFKILKRDISPYDFFLKSNYTFFGILRKLKPYPYGNIPVSKFRDYN